MLLHEIQSQLLSLPYELAPIMMLDYIGLMKNKMGLPYLSHRIALV